MSRSSWILCILILAGCVTAGQGKGRAHFWFLENSSAVLSFMNSYTAVNSDFERGRIMKARSGVLAMEQSNKDYVRAHKLLKEKIEPARRRLFIHYLRKAKKAEADKRWSEAMSAYEQAKDITIKPEVMENKRLEMEYKLRQLRLNALLSRRRKEDLLLINPNAYEPPKGVNPEDAVFYRKREQYEDDLDDRATSAYREAKRYLRKGMPDIAYIDIESYLRLQPDSDRGKKLLKEINDAMPRQLSIPSGDSVGTVPSVRRIVQEEAVKKDNVQAAVAQTQLPGQQESVQRVVVPDSVSADQIQALIQRGDLRRAKKYAQAYRREGGQDAARLLAKIQRSIEKKASDLFAMGGAAFRQEHLDRAIGYWSEAVTLMPEKSEYAEAFRRARQLKERLTFLRQASDGEPVEIEE